MMTTTQTSKTMRPRLLQSDQTEERSAFDISNHSITFLSKINFTCLSQGNVVQVPVDSVGFS
jgi:hypothetical protein